MWILRRNSLFWPISTKHPPWYTSLESCGSQLSNHMAKIIFLNQQAVRILLTLCDRIVSMIWDLTTSHLPISYLCYHQLKKSRWWPEVCLVFLWCWLVCHDTETLCRGIQRSVSIKMWDRTKRVATVSSWGEGRPIQYDPGPHLVAIHRQIRKGASSAVETFHVLIRGGSEKNTVFLRNLSQMAHQPLFGNPLLKK